MKHERPGYDICGAEAQQLRLFHASGGPHVTSECDGACDSNPGFVANEFAFFPFPPSLSIPLSQPVPHLEIKLDSGTVLPTPHGEETAIRVRALLGVAADATRTVTR